MNNYTVYHLHSDLSNCVANIDSITKYTEYIDYAQSLGMKALGFSEHGNVMEWYFKKLGIEKAGMKYIHAEEFYITEKLFDYPEVTDEFYEATLGMDEEEVQKELQDYLESNKKKLRDNYHCVLIAKNYDGFLELNQLSSKSFNRQDGHFYYRPRITIDELINTSDNIIVTTACVASALHVGTDEIKEKYINFLRNNKHRCFLEIQHHNVDEQKQYNKYLYNLSKSIGVPLIAGTDTHALNDKHMEGRAMLQKAKDVKFSGEEDWDMTFKSYDELVNAYKLQDSLPLEIVLEAIDNTNKMADRIDEFTIDTSYKYPHLWNEPEKLFNELIQEGIKKREVDKKPNFQAYIDRIEYEKKAYIHNGAIDFMLLMQDIINWCSLNGIEVGYGRGSVNGSVIAWLLGITEMDSIKHNLNFDRFMNIERVSLSDIDTDFPPSRIEDVKKYITSKHGLHCSDIITFNTISDKGAIREIGRALGIPLETVNGISATVDNEKEYEKAKSRYKDLFYYVDLVKNTIVSMGSHPCGLVCSPLTLEDNMAICTSSTSEYPISQIYMKEIDAQNYVKLDLLKLDTIEVINETCKLAGIDRLTPDNVNINDDKVWNAIKEDTTAIFQWEGSTGQDYIEKLLSDETLNRLRKITPDIDKMTLLSIGNSAIRPAGESYREDLSNGVVRKTGSKPIDDFLSNTFGYLVFQEQIIAFLHEYCGFTMGEADVVRRGIAKKVGTEQFIPIIKNGGELPGRTHHIDGYIKTMVDRYGIDENKSEEDIVAFIQVIEDASNYLFSLNHSQPYSYEGYVCGYLRTYYPVQFLTVNLNINSDKEKKTKALIEYAKKVGIEIRSPKFGFSRSGYFCDVQNKVIYKGVGSIKFMNNEVPEQLYELSQRKKYTGFLDLLKDLTKTNINSRQLDILIKLDYFTDFGDINHLLKAVDLFNTYYSKKYVQKDKLSLFEIDEDAVRKIAISETKTRFTVDMDQFLNLAVGLIKYEPCTLTEKIKYQIELLGYTNIIRDDLPVTYITVLDVNNRYTPKITAYCLKNGKTCDIKVHKSRGPKDTGVKVAWRDCPLDIGDVVVMNKCSKELAVKKVEDKWVKQPGQYVWWLNDYKKIEALY